jgi:serine-type D-Ala-D-Ala carboxypeptidase/endopeptidase (penicillin-binding protein 4)
MHKRTAIVFIIFYSLITSVFSQVPQDTSIKKMIAEIKKFGLDPALKKASWGICILTADSGKTVYALNDTTGLIPASTMKAINTAATLHMLGKDYTFMTYLMYDGDITKDSVLHGNIYIKGGGDPTLGSPRIDTMNDMKYLMPRWVDKIRQQGIKKIEGAVVGDASIFDDSIAPSTWVYGDLGNYYGAGASGLSFHENSFIITLKPGKKYKDSARITGTDPKIPYLTIRNKVTTGSAYTADDLWVYGGPYDNTRIVKGVVPRNNQEFSMRVSLPDPAAFCAYSLFRALSDSGIVVTDSATTYKDLKAKGKLKSRSLTVFYSQKSPPLDTIMYYTNQKSLNSYAENILKILAYEKTGTGSTYAGTRLVTEFWKTKGMDLNGFIMKDGSGLSPEDRVSPRQLAQFMRAYIPDTMFPVFYHTLPIAGVSGTIGSIFKGTIAENNLRAKSGYMRGLRSYTGYVYNKKNKLLTFGIMVNNHTASATKMRSMLEKIMVCIAETEW